jgi:dCTP deaminase
MAVLTGAQIRARGILTPHVPKTEMIACGVRTTSGESYCGYDLRLAALEDTWKVGENHWVLEPGAFALASAIEKFDMPNDVVGIVHDKSSWARRGLAVQNTVIEPGWRGYLTLELTNHSDAPIVLCRGMGICQVLFHTLTEPVEGYDGKYQDQGQEPTPAR